MDRADEELLASIRAGDDAALGALLARYAPAIYRFGVRMCRDPEDAKDVLQDTPLAAARGIREFRGASSLSTWLHAVARSFCFKKRRSSKFAPTDTVSLDDRDGALEARALGKARAEVRARLEDRLPFGERASQRAVGAGRPDVVALFSRGEVPPDVQELVRKALRGVTAQSTKL